MDFPAGGIATASHPFGPAQELTWKPLLARLVHARESPVVPVYVDGENSRVFQIASQVSLILRLSLILREALQKAGEVLSVRVRPAIPYGDLALWTDPAATTQHVRWVALDQITTPTPNRG